MTNYRITPHINPDYSNVWGWYACRSHDFGGDTPNFAIAKANHYNLAAGMRVCCWAQSADTDTWYDFDNLSIGATDITFSNNTPFPAGLIYVSHFPLYPFSRVQRKVNEWSQSQWVSETASTTNLVLGTATPRSVGDDSGRTAPALPFYGFKITGDRVGNKNKAILSTLSHATETPGAYNFEATIEYLLGNTPTAENLRDYFEFYCYPCLNPQSVWSGWFRTSVQIAGTSHDWLWNTTGVEESIDAFKTAFTADTGGTIDVGLDYHSYMSNSGILAEVHTGDTGGNNGFYNTEMQILDGGFALVQADLTNALCYYHRNTLGASLGMTMEQGCSLTRNIADFRTFGENSMIALNELLNDGRFTYGP